MNLKDIYAAGGLDALRPLAEMTNMDIQYIRQCASTSKTRRRPSPSLTAKLILIDPRLTWEDIYEEEIDAAKKHLHVDAVA